jgi:hypothetical protein
MMGDFKIGDEVVIFGERATITDIGDMIRVSYRLGGPGSWVRACDLRRFNS